MKKESKPKQATQTKSTNIKPSKVVIENPTELDAKQKALVEDIVGKPAESKPAESKPAESKPAESKPAESKPAESKPAEEQLTFADSGETQAAQLEPDEANRQGVETPDAPTPPTYEKSVTEDDPKILEQRAKQEENEAIAAVPEEKQEHLENAADIRAHLVEEKPKAKQFSGEELLDALYWIHYIFEKATMTMILYRETGQAALDDKPLTGDKVYIATRQLEWDSGNVHVIHTLAQYAAEGDGWVEYKANNGVPVYLRILPDDYCISSPDTKLYAHEYFQLPNPFPRFKEVYGD